MSRIGRMEVLKYEGLRGTEVFKMCAQLKAGTPQEVLVVCEPGAIIEEHTHAVDAEMFIVAGRGRVRSADRILNGKIVGPGDIVFFEKNVSHGFDALESGLSFVSRNGGIVDQHGTWDIRFKSTA